MAGQVDRRAGCRWKRVAATAAGCGLAAVLAACGGGTEIIGPVALDDCGLAAQRTTLRSYMRSWYLFNDRMPDPDPAGFNAITDYFEALRVNPPDRWSYVQDSASYNQFFAEGQSLGYGLFVAGQASDPVPLRVRFVTPGSPADQAGLRRGMVVDAINGVAVAPGGDFSGLSPAREGDTVQLSVRDTPAAATARSLTLSATTHGLTPVSTATVLTSAGGRKAAYLHYKDFIGGGQGPTLAEAFADLKAQGATELVLDMRYNGGGSIAIARDLASLVAGASKANQAFATLAFNGQHTNSNFTYAFASPAAALNLSRVMVLAGVRTCSASELVVNGLRGVGVNAVQIGATTCGKPYGFRPYAQCGNTYSAVNFRSVNAQGQADYDNGLAPQCPVADDFDHALGDPAERLTAAALSYIDNGACPSAAAREGLQSRPAPAAARRLIPEGERPPGMRAD